MLQGKTKLDPAGWLYATNTWSAAVVFFSVFVQCVMSCPAKHMPAVLCISWQYCLSLTTGERSKQQDYQQQASNPQQHPASQQPSDAILSTPGAWHRG
jgi:hypothetical protein